MNKVQRSEGEGEGWRRGAGEKRKKERVGREEVGEEEKEEEKKEENKVGGKPHGASIGC